jgi:hypothetical protein
VVLKPVLLKKVVLSCAVTLSLLTAPALAQSVPSAGPASDDPLAFWEGYSIGTYLIVGGLAFVVVAGGLQLLDGDDDEPTSPPGGGSSGPTATTTT